MRAYNIHVAERNALENSRCVFFFHFVFLISSSLNSTFTFMCTIIIERICGSLVKLNNSWRTPKTQICHCICTCNSCKYCVWVCSRRNVKGVYFFARFYATTNIPNYGESFVKYACFYSHSTNLLTNLKFSGAFCNMMCMTGKFAKRQSMTIIS